VQMEKERTMNKHVEEAMKLRNSEKIVKK